jgi:phage gp29-like protein
MAIIDTNGNPIKTKTKELTQELARPSLMGVRNAWGHGTVSNGLTPERLAQILRAADSGDHHAYLTLAEEMEERDAHYGSVLRTRKLAVSGLQIIVEAASDDEHDIALADALREQIEKPEFSNAVDDLLDGLAKGYSVVEIVWQRGQFWQPQFAWRDPRFFQFDKETGSELRLIDEVDMVNGLPLPKYRFMTHIPKMKSGLTVRSGLARMAAIAYLCKCWTLKDWMSFVDLYGLPLRVGKFGRGATEQEIDTLITAISNIASDAGAVIPESMQLEFVEAAKASGGGTGVFLEIASYLDAQLSKAVLGQTMTTDNGSSQSQANVHNEVRLDILKADAVQLGNTLQRDFAIPFIDINHGVQPRYPRIVVYVPDNEDLALLITALEKLVPLGLEVEQSVIRDKFGLPDPVKNGGKLLRVQAAPVAAVNHAVALNAVGQIAADNDEIDELVDESLKDWEKLMSPVINPIEELAANSSDYESFLIGLVELTKTTDPTALVESLALATFKARGMGDAGL